MGTIPSYKQENGQNKLNFDLINMLINHKKSYIKIKFRAKIYETNHKKSQYRSVFENIQKVIVLFDILVFLFGIFTLQYAM